MSVITPAAARAKLRRNHFAHFHPSITGERVAEWSSPAGGPIVHFNFGYVDGDQLTLSHSNFPRVPPASSPFADFATSGKFLPALKTAISHG